eukprot:SAG11_NODE_16009_length_559_cov_1.443478_1_plen_114_part_01
MRRVEFKRYELTNSCVFAYVHKIGLDKVDTELVTKNTQDQVTKSTHRAGDQDTQNIRDLPVQDADEYQPVLAEENITTKKYYQYLYQILRVPELAFGHYALRRIFARGIFPNMR